MRRSNLVANSLTYPVVLAARIGFRFYRKCGRAWSRVRVYSFSDEWWKEHAKSLREIAQGSSLASIHCPVVLDEPAHCPQCGFSTFVLVQPDEICGKCWIARLDRTIERNYPELEANRIKALVRAHVLL